MFLPSFLFSPVRSLALIFRGAEGDAILDRVSWCCVNLLLIFPSPGFFLKDLYSFLDPYPGQRDLGVLPLTFGRVFHPPLVS